MSTTISINAGQKATVSILTMVDGAGNPVSSLPAGAKVTYGSLSNYLTVTPNTDGVTAVVQASTPPAQGTVGSVQGPLSFTDQYGTPHSVPATETYSINFDPGVVTVMTLSSTTPA